MTQLLLAVAERVILQPTYLRIYKELKNHFHPVGWIIISSRISLRVPHFEKWTWKLLQCIHLSLYFHLKKGSLRKLTCWITYFKDSSFFSPFTLEISLPLAVFSQLWSITKHPGNKLCTTYCQIHTAPTMLTKNNKKKPTNTSLTAVAMICFQTSSNHVAAGAAPASSGPQPARCLGRRGAAADTSEPRSGSALYIWILITTAQQIVMVCAQVHLHRAYGKTTNCH